MRIALMNVGFDPGEEDFKVSPPFGIMYVGAYLREQGNEVRLFDWSGEDLDKEKRRTLEAYRPDIIGFHVKISSVIERAMEVSGWGKEIGAKIVWGGPGPSILPEIMLRDGPVDVLVLGEGEATMAELIEAISSGRSLDTVRGIAFLDNGKFVRTAMRPRIKDLGSLPMPLWSDLGDLSRYHIPMHGRNAVPLITSRGCPGNCTFCYTKVMWGYKWSPLSPERIIEEIELVRSLDPEVGAFIFNDDLFSLDTRRVRKLCGLLKERGIDILWNCEMRADTVEADLLNVMRDAGCRQILVGFESGSQRMLDLVDKETSIEVLKRAYKAIHESGMEAYSMIIVGLPGETEQDIVETEKLLNEVRSDFNEVCVYVPYPGTKLFELAKENGFQEPTDLRGWAKMGTLNLATLSEKGVSKVPPERVVQMMERTSRRAKYRSYVQEFKRAPLSSPFRGLRFVLRRKKEKDIVDKGEKGQEDGSNEPWGKEATRGGN